MVYSFNHLNWGFVRDSYHCSKSDEKKKPLSELEIVIATEVCGDMRACLCLLKRDG